MDLRKVIRWLKRGLDVARMDRVKVILGDRGEAIQLLKGGPDGIR